MIRSLPRSSRWNALAACLFALLLFPALAHADVETITFDSPLPLNLPLNESAGHRIRFPTQEGFRPYPTEVAAGRAKSGTAVGHIGRCVEEAEATGAGNPEGCISSHAQTTGVLTQTAKSVTVFAGAFDAGPSSFVVLKTFNAEGRLLESTGPQPLPEAGLGFILRLEVQDTAGRIAKFTVESSRGPSGEGQAIVGLGIDDLSVDFATNGDPDFFLTGIPGVQALVGGQHLDVPVRATRLNGSHGPIELIAIDLPDGVSSSALRLEGDETEGTLRLTAAPTAPDTDFVPTTATLIAHPVGVAVGKEDRTTPLSVRVATDFRLGSGEVIEGDERKILVQAPDCAPVDVPIRIDRDIAMNRDVTLAVAEEAGEEVGPPHGVSAEFLPSATVAPGGNLTAERVLRLRAGPESDLASHPLHLIVSGSDGPGGTSRSLDLLLTRTNRASVGGGPRGTDLGDTPRFGREGTAVQVHGLGFCPGTAVAVGNDRAIVPARLVDDRTLEFQVPRYATTGQLGIIPPGPLSPYRSEDPLTVDSVRNSDGFAFKNYPVDSFGITEFTKAYGADSLFIHVNPCWPFGDCSINTGILSPLAAIDWGWMNIGLRGSGGHCVGISLAAEQLQEGRLRYREIADPERGSAHSAFEATNRGGANEILNSLLDAYQAREYSDEFLSARWNRSPSLGPQLARLEAEFSQNRLPMIVLQKGTFQEHAVIAYHLAQTANKAEISVYDSEDPFGAAEELAETNPSPHQAGIDTSTITIDKVRGTWSYPIGNWSGSTSDGGFWVVPPSATPDHPSLPGLDALEGAVNSVYSMTFGSADGSAQVGGGRVSPPHQQRGRLAAASAQSARAAEFLPTAEAGAAPGTSGAWVSGDGRRPLEGAVEGLKSGHYTESYAAPGFVASATDVATAKGVEDEISGLRDSLSVDSGMSRPLRLNLARRASASRTDAATVRTHASGGGSDTVALPGGGVLSYAHDGGGATMSFSLTGVRRNGGGATFLSGPVPVRGGDRLRAVPMDRDLDRVRLELRHADGSRTTRVLRNRARPAGRIRLGTARVAGGKLRLPFKLAGFREAGVAGVSLRLQRGGRIVARRAIAKRAGNGPHRVVWKLPRRLGHGAYRLLVDLRVLTAGARGSTVSQSVLAKRGATVRLGG
ncbi:MAG TPA: hypothetical protein VHI77_07495 [Solirubrobacterales bacterium]|nr:hypothetical protein [Solirubrobacterales bacterium]